MATKPTMIDSRISRFSSAQSRMPKQGFCRLLLAVDSIPRGNQDGGTEQVGEKERRRDGEECWLIAFPPSLCRSVSLSERAIERFPKQLPPPGRSVAAWRAADNESS